MTKIIINGKKKLTVEDEQLPGGPEPLYRRFHAVDLLLVHRRSPGVSRTVSPNSIFCPNETHLLTLDAHRSSPFRLRIRVFNFSQYSLIAAHYPSVRRRSRSSPYFPPNRALVTVREASRDWRTRAIGAPRRPRRRLWAIVEPASARPPKPVYNANIGVSNLSTSFNCFHEHAGLQVQWPVVPGARSARAR